MSSKQKQKQQQQPQSQLWCAMCEKIGAPSCNTCSGCGAVAYCNAECQKAHWAIHRPDCNRIKKEKKEREKEEKAKKETVPSSVSVSGLGDMGSLLNALMPPPQPQRYEDCDIYNA